MKKKDLQNALGFAFEQELARAFPSLLRLDSTYATNPDFLYNSSDKSCFIEAKVAYGGHDYDSQTGLFAPLPQPGKAYGAQIKEYQIMGFKALHKLPLLYAFGFHGIAHSTQRYYANKSQKKRDAFIEREFCVPSIYFVSGEIISSIFAKEWRHSKKAREYLLQGESIPSTLPKKYCSVKPRQLDQIIAAAIALHTDNPILAKRQNELVCPLSYYGIDPISLSVSQLGQRQTTHRFNTNSGEHPIRIGHILTANAVLAFESMTTDFLEDSQPL